MPYFKVFYPSEMPTPAIPPRRVIAIYFFFPRSIRRRLDVVSKRVYLFTQFSFTHFFYFFLSVSYIYISILLKPLFEGYLISSFNRSHNFLNFSCDKCVQGSLKWMFFIILGDQFYLFFQKCFTYEQWTPILNSLVWNVDLV